MYIGLLEDEAHLAQHVSDILATAGHTVTVFPDGAAMVKAIGRDTFDLFVLDWRVPKMTGIEVLKVLRICQPLTRALIVSGHVTPAARAEFELFGQHDFIQKPYRLAELGRTVRSLLDTRALVA